MFAISFALSLTDSGYPRRSARRRRSAFARFTRYSASLICPAIATAVVSSSGKIFWTTLLPTKKPFAARLSAARTTPSLLLIPTVVVMSHLGEPWRRRAMLTEPAGNESQGSRAYLPTRHFTRGNCVGRLSGVSGFDREGG